MCRQQSRACLTAEEALAAEESLSIYCKPVELYNILQRRAIRNPSFLLRCLDYKIQAKRKRRIQINVSICGSMNDGVRSENVFPLYVLLGIPVVDIASSEQSSSYRFSEACLLTSFSDSGLCDSTQANFVVPDFKKCASNVRVGSLTIVIVSCGEEGATFEHNRPKHDEELASLLSKLGGNCCCGKLQIETLCLSLDKCVSLSLGHKTEMRSTIDMKPSIVEPCFLDDGHCLSFRTQNLDCMNSYKVQVSICAQEIGAMERSPYSSYTYNDIPAASLSHIISMRTGNVLFNYRYYNNTLQKTEVTEDFSCPFCLVQCGSFEGLRHHLTSSHDLFSYEFWVTEEYQAVNVSVRSDVWRSEVLADGVDLRLETFFHRSSRFKRRKLSSNLVQKIPNVHPHVLDSDSPEDVDDTHEVVGTSSIHRIMTYSLDDDLPNDFTNRGFNKEERRNSKGLFASLSSRHKSESFCSENTYTAEFVERVASSPDMVDIYAATAQNFTSNGCNQPMLGSSITPPTLLQFAKSRKLSMERTDPRNRTLLTKRQFFHSHRAQPMALEQVLSDRDSEDEVDDDIADFEDRRMLDDFVDVTKDEKQIMHLWNSFVRKQRVLADGHIPWACEAFSQLHGQDLVRAPALLWCWRLFLIKQWNHCLLDARTINNCNLILERFQNGNADQKQG